MCISYGGIKGWPHSFVCSFTTYLKVSFVSGLVRRWIKVEQNSHGLGSLGAYSLEWGEMTRNVSRPQNSLMQLPDMEENTSSLFPIPHLIFLITSCWGRDKA